MTLASMTRPAVAPDLCGRLRQRSADAHAALEASLDLLHEPSHEKIATLLERFLGFHLAWERALAPWPRVAAFMEGRSRVAALHADLARLGRTPLERAAVAPAPSCADLASTEAAAVGSAYVLEGSTLGGRLIARALAGATWAPAEGLAYFDPYGEARGRMWRTFRAWAEEMVPPPMHETAAEGATATFARLQAWLAP